MSMRGDSVLMLMFLLTGRTFLIYIIHLLLYVAHAFVVGRNGKIYWAGNPLGPDLESAVREVLAAPTIVTPAAAPMEEAVQSARAVAEQVE